MNRRKVFAAVGMAAAMSGMGVVTSPSQAHADEISEFLNCAVLNGISCVNVVDAMNWSRSVTAWKFGEGPHNNMGDAFRHCTWIGALATRIGEQDAYRVGFVHEEHDPTRVESETKMDDWNNFIGAGIGAAAVRSGVSDQWGYVLNECESKARSYELYGLNGVKGNYSG